MPKKTVHEMFSDFTQVFSADGFAFLKMRAFLEELEADKERSPESTQLLLSFKVVARLCSAFIKD